MHNTAFLQDLAVVMIVAGLVTILFHRFKQPVVLGYILAGVIIGPHTPPFRLLQDEQTIQTLAELGVIFLMFSLGLEFSLRKLKEVGATAFIAATFEILLMIWVGYEIGRVFGWKKMDCIFLGAILSISSTTIIIKALGELGKTKEKFAQLIFGILIVEDILAIVMLALLSGLATTGSLKAEDTIVTVLRLSIFLIAVLVAGLLTVPRLLRYVARFKSNEMLLVAVLGLCFSVSLLAVKLHYSVALGAFLIGAIMAEAREIGKIETLMEPIRDMFSAVFFVTIGLLIEPALLVKYAMPIAVITAAVVVGKVVTCSLGTFVAGHDTRTSLRVGMGLAQIGEFSFIIAALGLTLKVTSDFLYPIAVTVSVITTLLTPYLIKSSDGLVTRFDRVAPRSLVDFLGLYHRWVQHLGGASHDNFARKFMRRVTVQLTINCALIAAIFISAAALENTHPVWLPTMPAWLGGSNSLLWFCSLVLASPIYLANFRKVQAIGMLVSEITVKRAQAGANTNTLRMIVTNTVSAVGILGLCLLTLVLSAPLLPPMEVLIVLLILLAIMIWLLSSSLVRVYARAQVALAETLTQPAPVKHHEPERPQLTRLLKDAELETVTLANSAPVLGRLIREIGLRTRTGASIVGIERNGESIVNPEPDEEFKAGDVIFLLGSQPQLLAASALLQGTTGEQSAA